MTVKNSPGSSEEDKQSPPIEAPQQPVGSQTPPQIADRLTIALTKKSKEALQTILDVENMTNKTDAVNRSLTMRAFFLARSEEWELVLRNRENGQTHVVHFL